MKKRTSAFVLALSTLFLPFAVHAADDDGNFRIKGMGTQTCQAYLSASASNQAALIAYRSWLNGYITAQNFLSPSTYDVAGDIDLGTMMSVVANFCRSNPNLSFITAAAALIRALEPHRLRESAQSVDISSGDQRVTLAQETILSVQEALSRRGLDPGAHDGVFGQKTRAALEEFQKGLGLVASGVPDQATLLQLLQ